VCGGDTLKTTQDASDVIFPVDTPEK